ncbi:MAG: hypothetical protein FJ271_31255 [Planctomycetes bacterium]|nr:hypothetical protein [Planctomycetota bacterium]
MRLLTIPIILAAALAAVPALEGQGPTSLPVRSLTLKSDHIGLADALAAIKRQTGTAVVDRRSAQRKDDLRLDLDRATFWQGLDAIARQADARISLYQEDGTIALVNGPYRTLPTSMHGIFRTTVRRLAVARNLETARDVCTIEVETAWEPWFQPFLMEIGPATARYLGPMNRPVAATIAGQGRFRVAGRASVTELRMPAPPRAAQLIDMLAGSFKIIGPTRMLVFRFDELKPTSKKPLGSRQDGVKVELTRILSDPEKWSFDLRIENPPGGPTYESHQADLWMRDNRIWLQKGDGKSAVIWKHSGAEEPLQENQDARRSAVRYHFPLGDSSAVRNAGKPEDWSLRYTTPGPIVETRVEFSFKDLPLP